MKKIKKAKVNKRDTVPLFYNFAFGVDLFGPGSYALGSDGLSAEAKFRLNLKNRFMPVVELGMGYADCWSESGIHYKGHKAPYLRIGMDYNTMFRKKDQKNFLYTGIRYGFTSLKYDVASLAKNDPIWKDEISNPAFQDEIWGETTAFNRSNMTGSMQWLEFLVGVNVNVYKNFDMGWALRFKYKISSSQDKQADLWYVPGYGKYKTTNLGITYSIIYKLPF